MPMRLAFRVRQPLASITRWRGAADLSLLDPVGGAILASKCRVRGEAFASRTGGMYVRDPH
jgi:hypothetical protein